ncbi:GntP family permease [Aeoliella sp.]|uniref:GntP family permease n=1 Tax=Aeoliella sp. TaxID=2795800 RepID=UPI003CCB8DEC
MESTYPFLILAVGLATVIGGIVALRINAFLSLLLAAIVVSLMAPGDWEGKIPAVTAAFGSTAANIGIVIALAAVIGKTMMDSGAADRIVRAALVLFGEKRAAGAMMASSFTLAIPVFFDTVFYLIVPLARSMHRRTGKNYLKYLLAIASAASAHALVPPTPGPLAVASELGVNLGVMILVGIAVGAPAALLSLLLAACLNRRIPVEPPVDGFLSPDVEEPPRASPGLLLSLTPVVLPVVLIASKTIADASSGIEDLGTLYPVVAVLGNPNVALLISCTFSMLTYCFYFRPTRTQFVASIEQALTSGGMIILITCAGGAFGAMLKQAQLAPAIESSFGTSASGLGLLLLGFGIASLLKFAQGSSTAAMLVAAGMMSAMMGELSPAFHPVYLATAIGSGSLVGSWMNDSGFWIFSRMSGLTELETLKTWTPLLAMLGLTSMAMTLLLATLMPLV